jgi:hypothetical protein
MHIDMQHGAAALKILRANRFAMIGQQFLPQFVVYRNPARGGGPAAGSASCLPNLALSALSA